MTRSERRRRSARKRARARLAVVVVAIAFALSCISSIVDAGGSERIPGDTVQMIVTQENLTEGYTQEQEAAQEGIELNYLSDEIPLDYDAQIYLLQWCEQYLVPYTLALAVIETESSFQADASNGSCYGYMQINSINREWLMQEIGVTDLTDPLQNLHAGVFILSELYGDYRDWNMALTAYNYGPTGAEEHVFSQGYTSSKYSRHVLELYKTWMEVIGE